MSLRFNFQNRGQSQKTLSLYERMIVSQEFRLAGIQFHHGLRLYQSMRVGDTLTMRHEPENPYDKNAIAVYLGEDQIGYVEKGVNEDLLRVLRNYGPSSTVLVIAAKDESADLYNKILIVAYTVFYTVD